MRRTPPPHPCGRCGGARAVRAPCGRAAVPGAALPPRAGPTVCLCATQPSAHCGCAACEAGWPQELGARGEPHALRRRRSLPSAHRRVCARAIAGLRASGERRALEPGLGATPRYPTVPRVWGGVHIQRTKTHQPSPKPVVGVGVGGGGVQGAGAHVSAGPNPSRGCLPAPRPVATTAANGDLVDRTAPGSLYPKSSPCG